MTECYGCKTFLEVCELGRKLVADYEEEKAHNKRLLLYIEYLEERNKCAETAMREELAQIQKMVTSDEKLWETLLLARGFKPAVLSWSERKPEIEKRYIDLFDKALGKPAPPSVDGNIIRFPSR